MLYGHSIPQSTVHGRGSWGFGRFCDTRIPAASKKAAVRGFRNISASGSDTVASRNRSDGTRTAGRRNPDTSAYDLHTARDPFPPPAHPTGPTAKPLPPGRCCAGGKGKTARRRAPRGRVVAAEVRQRCTGIMRRPCESTVMGVTSGGPSRISICAPSSPPWTPRPPSPNPLERLTLTV